jgi:hypothetical protein
MARLKAAPFSEQLQIDPAPRKERGATKGVKYPIRRKVPVASIMTRHFAKNFTSLEAQESSQD